MTDPLRPVVKDGNDEAYKAPVNEVNPNNKKSGEVVEGEATKPEVVLNDEK